MRFLHHAFHMSKIAMRLAAAILRAVLQAVLAIVAVFCRLLGIQPPRMPQPFVPSITTEDVRDEYKGAFTREIANDHAHASNLGSAVHQYAVADHPGARCAVDLGGLSTLQTDWLLGLSDEDLQRLAAAGPKACELAVSGKRCGVVGLPVPVTALEPASIDSGNVVRDLLMDRIRARRGPELAA